MTTYKYNKNNGLTVKSKLLVGVFGLIYAKKAIYLVKLTTSDNVLYTNTAKAEHFHEVKKMNGTLLLPVYGKNTCKFNDGESVELLAPSEDYLLICPKGYDEKKPVPNITPRVVPEYVDTPDVKAANIAKASIWCINGFVSIPFSRWSRKFNTDDFRLVYRMKNGRTWIEVTARGAEERIPDHGQYQSVFTASFLTVLKDGLAVAVTALSRNNAAIRTKLPLTMMEQFNIPKTGKQALPCWFDSKNERFIIEMPTVVCDICEDECSSIDEEPSVPVTFCEKCGENTGSGNELDKLVSMFSTLTNLVSEQNEKLDKLIAAQNHSGGKEPQLKELRAALNKVVNSLNSLDI